jgi:hypothetical protein
MKLINYKEIKLYYLFYMQRRKIWLKFSSLFLLWLYFFSYFLWQQKLVVVSQFFIVFKLIPNFIINSYTIFYYINFSNIIFFITVYINIEKDIECVTDADCPKSVNMCFITKCIDEKCKSIEILVWVPDPEYNKTLIERMSVSARRKISNKFMIEYSIRCVI